MHSRMWYASFALLFVILARETSCAQRFNSPWSYVCKNDRCIKQEATATRATQLTSCKLTCGKHGGLWPKVAGKVVLSKPTTPFYPWNILPVALQCSGDACDGSTSTMKADVAQLLRNAFSSFKSTLAKTYNSQKPFDLMNSALCPNGPWTYVLEVSIHLKSPETKLTLITKENYGLTVKIVGNRIKVSIVADTFFGARHGLETLSQLIDFDGLCRSLQIVSNAEIEDSPVFPYRGVLLDTSRNFFSVKSILKLIDAMAYNKLNTLHWHITDTHSFPIYVKSQPQMTQYGAYSSKHVYKPDDVKAIVEHGKQRGIRVMPEFDEPAHCGNGWQWGEKAGLGKMALCVNEEPWQKYCVEPPCGQLNPLNENMYKVLGNIFKDYMEMFDSDIFHIGGDEVKLHCWNVTDEIVQWMVKQGKMRTEQDFMDLWGIFQQKAVQKLVEANKGIEVPLMFWTSKMTKPKYIEKYLNKSKYIIQIWTDKTDKTIANLVNKGYRVVFSNYDHLYLDCGFGSWVDEGNNWCSPYKGWQKFYDNNPYGILKKLNVIDPQKLKLVLGGEAAMWSEQVDEHSLEMKIWPRAAALAERLWANPTHNWRPAEFRMIHHRQRMVKRGIQADALQPLWCHQNSGLCYWRKDLK